MESATLSTKHTYSSKITRCLHCDTTIQNGKSFCCVGCESAYQLMHSMDIPSGNSYPVLSVFAKEGTDGCFTLTLGVGGLHCASCIHLIEKALLAEKDVAAARVNMTTERVSLTWKGKRERGDAFAAIVMKLGYKLHPIEQVTQDSASIDQTNILRCIAIAGFAMGNLMLISVGLWSTTGETMGVATRDLFHWVSALIAIPTIFYAGRPFFSSAIAVLKQRHTNMDVPISLAITLATLMSLVETFQHGEHVYFDSAVMLLFFLLIGRYLDIKAKGKAKQYAHDLLSMLQGTALVIERGKHVVMPISELKEGMQLLVTVGEKIPADGVITEGVAELDTSLITGETLPQHKLMGDRVFAGMINLSAPIRVTISKASEDSLLADIIRLMEKAEQGQAHYVRLADKAAQLYTPVVHTVGLMTFLGWLAVGEIWQASLLHAITVLIITCPCALGLAVPVVQVLASSRLMKEGVILKSGDALEKLAGIDVAVFDKTGTLTMGKPVLEGGSFSEQELQISATLAAHSRHPFSRAVSEAYEGELLQAEDVKEIAGCGVQGYVNGILYRLGSHAWCGGSSPDTKENVTEIWLSVNGSPQAKFSFTDYIRDDAKRVIEALQAHNIETVLLSGDRMEVVESVAKTVGIKHYKAVCTPLDKSSFIENLKQQNKHVLMVGDGLNDAPALALSDISMSPSTALDITQNTADIIFQGQKLWPVYLAWQTAKASNLLVKENFMLAILYNCIAIPIAVAGYVTPLVAAIAMSSSSLIVIGNSFRLTRLAKKAGIT